MKEVLKFMDQKFLSNTGYLNNITKYNELLNVYYYSIVLINFRKLI